jgi:hypothetical protein
MLSSQVYAYGTNLLPTDLVAEEVMKLNGQLAQVMRETGVTYNVDDLDQHFQALLRHLKNSSICRRSESFPPIISKEQ